MACTIQLSTCQVTKWEWHEEIECWPLIHHYSSCCSQGAPRCWPAYFRWTSTNCNMQQRLGLISRLIGQGLKRGCIKCLSHRPTENGMEVCWCWLEGRSRHWLVCSCGSQWTSWELDWLICRLGWLRLLAIWRFRNRRLKSGRLGRCRFSKTFTPKPPMHRRYSRCMFRLCC